jgi:AcrR family transcriptional regulator
VPRAGLDSAKVVAAGATLADEVGFTELTMGRLAERVGVRVPSLYKHIAGQDDLNRRIAALALAEAADAIGAATQGRAGHDALAAAARALRDFVVAHPGRYAATIGITPAGPGDPIAAAERRGLAPFEAVLRGYDIAPGEMPHALRALRGIFHGFATLQASGGFQWSTDIDESFEWLVDLVDRGLRATSTAGLHPLHR